MCEKHQSRLFHNQSLKPGGAFKPGSSLHLPPCITHTPGYTIHIQSARTTSALYNTHTGVHYTHTVSSHHLHPTRRGGEWDESQQRVVHVVVAQAQKNQGQAQKNQVQVESTVCHFHHQGLKPGGAFKLGVKLGPPLSITHTGTHRYTIHI